MGGKIANARLIYVTVCSKHVRPTVSGFGRITQDWSWPATSLLRFQRQHFSTNDAVLPKLPVPTLEHTMERYLNTMKPLLTDVQHERLRQLVEAFAGLGGPGPKLQLYLLGRQERLNNWAYDYWLKDLFLGNPAPLPVNSNPAIALPPRRFTTVLDLARFAARMLDAALDLKEILDRKALPIHRSTSHEKGQPLCMSQYYRIFSSCRLPGKTTDSQFFTPPTVQDSSQLTEHVIVTCRNQLYCLPVKAADRARLNEDELCAQFMHILDDAPCLANPPPVGLLTASHRTQWAEARESLAYDDQNRHNLDLIQRSLMIICLDEPLPLNFNCRLQRGAKGHMAGQRDETNMILQMIHGGGSTVNSANRWFDKTMQIIISKDGSCGACVEHSSADGVAMVQLIEKMLKHCDEQPASSNVPAATSSHLPPPERLEWTLDATHTKQIEDAAIIIDKLVEDLDHQVFRFAGYGKEFIKSCGCSSDVFIQLALQLTYYRLYGHLVATYGTASMRRFRLGRIDCIRSASCEALDWATVMAQAEPAGLQPDTIDGSEDELLNTGKKDQQKYELFQAAVKKQTEMMVENILGQGIDIHLLGLREAAKDTAPTAAHPLPALFTDETYQIANEFLLCTSQVCTETDSVMGYGALVPNGYAAIYNVRKESIVFGISAFHSSEITSVSRFVQALEESLNSMYNLLSRHKIK